ncbi:MAG: esterase family protein [Candidatus Carbobacillus altaicus]|nr:esterase family protein [Candidatus Carbobacillus altaicus]
MSAHYARKIIRQTIYSHFLMRTMDLRLFIPADVEVSLINVEKDVKNILYTQDGQYFFMYGRIATIAAKGIAAGELPPFYIVGVDVDLAKRRAWYHPEGPENEAYLAFFLEELLPAVEKLFPLPEHGFRRFLAGDSLGGTVSYQLALTRPDLFQGLIGLSTLFTDHLLEMLATKGQSLHHLKLFQYVGREEQAVETPLGTIDFLSQHRASRAILEPYLTRGYFVEKNGTHTWGAWQNILPEALHTIFQDTV